MASEHDDAPRAGEVGSSETCADEASEQLHVEHGEFEYSQDDILYYLVDEEGIEVGFVIEEDGHEIECYYEEFADVAFEPAESVEPAESAESAGAAAAVAAPSAQSSGNEQGIGITREGAAKMTADLNDIAREGAATARDLKETYDEIMDTFGFLMPKGARRR